MIKENYVDDFSTFKKKLNESANSTPLELTTLKGIGILEAENLVRENYPDNLNI